MTPFQAMLLQSAHFRDCKDCTLSQRCPEGLKLKQQYEQAAAARDNSKGAPVPKLPKGKK